MPAFDILSSRWPLTLALASTFILGVLAGQVLYGLDPSRALALVDHMDARRKPFLRRLYLLVRQPGGAIRAIAFILVVSLVGASLLQHTVGGLLIFPPFVYLFLGGLLVSLIVKRYPERFWITAIVSPFEFGAFAIAATGGVNLGLSIWAGRDPGSAAAEWTILFLTLVVPLQALNAILEGLLTYRLYRLRRESWPPTLGEL